MSGRWAVDGFYLIFQDVLEGLHNLEEPKCIHAYEYRPRRIFIATKLSDLTWLESQASINPYTNAPWDADASGLQKIESLQVHEEGTQASGSLQVLPTMFFEHVDGSGRWNVELRYRVAWLIQFCTDALQLAYTRVVNKNKLTT